jgi:hypothetical protein
MADQLASILQLWQRGSLILDEVDLLLHPLRSELNYPCSTPIRGPGPVPCVGIGTKLMLANGASIAAENCAVGDALMGGDGLPIVITGFQDGRVPIGGALLAAQTLCPGALGSGSERGYKCCAAISVAGALTRDGVMHLARGLGYCREAARISAKPSGWAWEWRLSGTPEFRAFPGAAQQQAERLPCARPWPRRPKPSVAVPIPSLPLKPWPHRQIS